MQHGYDLTDLSQSYPLRDDSSLHRRLEEQSRAFWREQDILRSRWADPVPLSASHFPSFFERILALAIVALIAVGWAYLIFS